jgi:hypothetical protein
MNKTVVGQIFLADQSNILQTRSVYVLCSSFILQPSSFILHPSSIILQASSLEDVSNRFNRPVGKTCSNHLSARAAQLFIWDSVGDAQCTHACQPARLNSWRGIFNYQTFACE